jgi:ankyrin repeat protein
MALLFPENTRNDQYTSDLLCAVAKRDRELARRVLTDDPEAIRDKDQTSGVSALHLAVFLGDFALIRLVFDAPGADPQAVDRLGRKPVDMCRHGQSSTIFRFVAERTYADAVRELGEPAHAPEASTPG